MYMNVVKSRCYQLFSVAMAEEEKALYGSFIASQQALLSAMTNFHTDPYSDEAWMELKGCNNQYTQARQSLLDYRSSAGSNYKSSMNPEDKLRIWNALRSLKTSLDASLTGVNEARMLRRSANLQEEDDFATQFASLDI